MRKQEFLDALCSALSGLPAQETEERLRFYDEMIDDRMEEGMTEEAAVDAIGSPEQAAAQIIRETPLTQIIREKVRPKRTLRTWEIVLLTLGAPLWLPLLLAAAAVVLSLYIVLWSIVLSLWTAAVSLAAGSLVVCAAAVLYVLYGRHMAGIAVFGVGVVCAGLTLFLILGCIASTKDVCRLTKSAALRMKTVFMRKETAR